MEYARPVMPLERARRQRERFVMLGLRQQQIHWDRQSRGSGLPSTAQGTFLEVRGAAPVYTPWNFSPQSCAKTIEPAHVFPFASSVSVRREIKCAFPVRMSRLYILTVTEQGEQSPAAQFLFPHFHSPAEATLPCLDCPNGKGILTFR